MPEETLFESERVLDRTTVATTLRTVADKLESGESVTLSAGGDEITVDPPESVEFEVSVEREGPVGDLTEMSLELELEWDEGDSGSAGGDGALTIE